MPAVEFVIDDRVRPLGGMADISAEPLPRLVEHNLDPRPWTATWLDPPFRPEPPDATQVYAICFDRDGLIVLIQTLEGGIPYWNLPGGGVKPGETLEECGSGCRPPRCRCRAILRWHDQAPPRPATGTSARRAGARSP